LRQIGCVVFLVFGGVGVGEVSVVETHPGLSRTLDFGIMMCRGDILKISLQEALLPFSVLLH